MLVSYSEIFLEFMYNFTFNDGTKLIKTLLFENIQSS